MSYTDLANKGTMDRLERGATMSAAMEESVRVAAG